METIDNRFENINERCDESINSQTLKSPFKRPLNECSVETKDDNCSDNAIVKKQKTIKSVIEEYYCQQLLYEQKSYLENMLELFYLEGRFGQFLEFPVWKKKAPNHQFFQYLTTNAFHSDEELKELIDLKTCTDSSSAKVSEALPSVQTSQSTSTVSRITTPSAPTCQPIVSSSSVSIPPSIQTTNASTTVTNTVLKESSSTSTALTPVSTPTGSRHSSNQMVSGARLATRQQHPISSFYDSAIGSQEQIVERAKQEAYVMQRIAELRKNGLWSSRRLPKVQEPPRSKVHWDYLLEEMQWLAADFAQERKWKKAAAKKCARMVVKYHSDKRCHAEKAEKEELLRLKKIASNIAKQIKTFWSDIEKVFEAKQEVKLKEKRKKLHDMHLNFIVDKADKYTERLTQELGKSLNTGDDSAFAFNNSQSEEAIDREFVPEMSESDDEETIAKEEEEVGVGDGKQEIELLQKESQMSIEDLKASFGSNDDNDFKVDEQSINAEDDEETIEEQEENEGKVDYSNEMSQLESDANIPIEELLKKYESLQNFASLEEYIRDSDDEETDDEEDISDDFDNDNEDDFNEDEEDFGEDQSTEEETGEIGMEFLINPDVSQADKKPLIEEISNEDNKDIKKNNIGPNKEITDIAAGAESLQPKGNTLSAVQVCTKVPFLLKHELREYQHIGLDWLVAMQDKKLNGILADEMGLGKTIQTIALIAHLACEKGIWGPHLIVVPTSVMLNWEMEFKKWCPAFKILTYYGSPKERKLKRQGWTKPNQFHICITSYKLVIQDHQSFRRKKWKYFILDEAQHIKNFKSQRWQMLLNFNTSRRLLLTGTPLQNNLMELWSLMHFLMPNVFQSHKEFKDWFVNPVTGMVEGNSEFNEGLIRRLHKVLRPFLLRRLKCDVEKQLPKKYEHIIMCRLSKRQRFLYEEFMSLGKTKETLANGNFLSVINILMQLRKVCNHPNLFDPRPTISPFMTEGLTYKTASLVTTALDYDPLKHINLNSLNLILSNLSFTLSAFAHHRIARFMTSPELIQEIDSTPEPPPRCPRGKIRLQIRTSTATMHSTVTSPKSTVSSTPTPLPAANRHIEQKFLIAHNIHSNAGMHSQNGSTTSKLSTTTTSSTDGNRVAIPLTRLVQTPAGQHILLRTSTGTPISSTLSPTTTIMRPQSPMRQIILTRTMPPVVGITNPQEQYVTCAPLTSSSKSFSSPFRKTSLVLKQQTERKEKLKFLSRINSRKCSATALYSSDLIEVATINKSPKFLSHSISFGSSIFNTGNGYLNCLLAPHSGDHQKDFWEFTHTLNQLIKTPERIVEELNDVLTRYVCIVPRVISPQIRLHASHLPPSKKSEIDYLSSQLSNQLSDRCNVLKIPISQMRTQFPELRLIQYDCGKLQTLDRLLWELKTGGHRVLIFTQMSRMLDIFEQFLNHHGHTYLRLDGTTKVEQRQALMERFNADKRIFCFILSTRSGGIGVNLTGADTVIFYDSDWNPTMDAQAQDRCHRIGQTRDVHIYRLISEMSVEENILKKAQQKKLLGSVAIEGGNFTTAFFKRNAIQDLFGIDLPNEYQSITSDSTTIENLNDNIGDAQLEQALCTVEEDNDVAAAKTARAEAAAEFAEFDENIPIDIDNKEEDKSAEEEKIDELIDQLKPVEKYAMHLLEVFQESVSFEQLKQAEEEIEAHKKEWELGRLQAEKEETLRLKEALDGEKEPILTCHREDAYNQVYISYNGLEQMPVWAPPTPPQDENDLYIDYSLGFLYEQSLMPESQLPPVYIPKETNKRLKLDTTIARKQKARKEEGFNIPRSLFDRPSTAIIKLRRELILQKLKGSVLTGPDSAAIHRTLNALGASCVLPPTNVVPSQLLKSSQFSSFFGGLHQESIPVWAIHEDWAVLQVIQYFQDLPLNLLILSPGHVPNWDFVSDVVNLISCNYRSPKLCKYHYEMSIVPREEGKPPNESNPKQKQKKVKGMTVSPSVPSVAVTPTVSTVSNVKPIATNQTTRPIRTSQLIAQDNNSSFSLLCNQRFETIKQIANKRTPTLKPMFINPTGKNPKHIALLSESGINYEQPLTPIQVAINRAERIAREKQKAVAEQQLAAARQQQIQQLQVKQQLQQQAPQIKAILTPNANIPAAQQQLQQAISAKVAALNQATLSKVSNASGIVSNASSTTATQLNLTKALSQVNVASLSNQSQHSIPQPILSQLSVNPQTIGSTTTASTSEAISQGIQVPQQTCSVVSVAAITPQVHQKIMAAVSPAVGQMGGQSIANRITTGGPHVYKQILIRQQQQQQLQQRQQQSQHIQIQTVPQTGKQIATLGVGQQPQRFQITATVAQQPVQHTQSLIATTGLKASQPNIVTSLPVAVPMTATQQQRIATTTTTTGKPAQQIITRTITDPLQMAQIMKRQQLVSQQPSGNLPQTQILLQHSATPQSQASQQQILQNPVTFVKTLSSTATLATQSLTIPITMTGMNIFTSPAAKVVSPTSSIASTTTTLSPVPSTQLRQIQLLQHKRPQQSTQVLQQPQQQQIQTHITQHLGQQNPQKVTTTTIAAQTKGIAQLQASPVGTFQILHQSSPISQNVQTSKPMQTTVTVQQLQQALKHGLVVPHNLSHTIHVSQSPVTTSGATLISQSILQAVTQSKPTQIETTPQSLQSGPIAVTQMTPNQQTVKHIQVVSTASSQTQSANVTPKSIIISGQPTILQTSTLQHPVQPQQPTVTFAIRAAAQTNISQQTQATPTPTPIPTPAPTISTTESCASTSTAVLSKDVESKEQMEESSLQTNQSVGQSQQVRQSPYATRQRNNKTV